MARGTLITIEGIDGAGKSTLAAGLVDALAERDVPVTLLREPGGVRTAERIRELVHDPAATIGARAEALLYAAARAQLVEEALEPLLAAGNLVLLDRFVDSSLAYQGAGRGLGIDAIAAINAFGTGGLVPDRTLLLRIDPAAGRSRSVQRGAPPDRLEQQPDAFFERIAEAYDALAASDGARIRVINADQLPPAVLADALAAIADLVG
ncbi:MAG TPA: dTMP kinase [Solirubrobacteraceae bacterium]|jgi:dTMP kinase|nr:dTMP kinase [Solirubrobacteraceae bacterium]